MKKSSYIVGTDSAVTSIFFEREYRNVSRIHHANIVVFTGGADISPSLYKEKPIPKTYPSLTRDNQDLKAWDNVKNNRNIFKVGICRGGQLLNVLCGGSMWQHVNNHSLGWRDTHEAINLLRLPNTIFNAGTKIILSSVHHQMMIPGENGEVLCFSNEATSFISPDSSKVPPKLDPEVIYYPEERCLCFQPHPEIHAAHQTRSYFFALIEYLYRL